MPVVSVATTARTSARSAAGSASRRASASSTCSRSRRSAAWAWRGAHARATAATSAAAPPDARLPHDQARVGDGVGRAREQVREADRLAKRAGEDREREIEAPADLPQEVAQQVVGHLLVVERTLRRVGRVLCLLQALLELAVEELALLPFRLDALAEALLDLSGARAQLVERRPEIFDRPCRRRRLVRDDGPELGVQRELGPASGALDREGLFRHGPNVAAGARSVKRGATPQVVRQCRRNGGAHQRVLLVAEPRQRLPGVQAQILLPLLWGLGRLGRRGAPGGASPLHPEAARVAAAVGRARRARCDRDGPPRLRPRPRHSRRALHRRRDRADAGRVALLQGGPLPRKSKIDGALRARVPGRAGARGVAGAQPQRRRLSPELLPPAAARRNPQDDARALVDRALVEGLRLREHGGVGRARLRFLDGAGAPGARGLEDGRYLPKRRGLPARLLRALRSRCPRR